MWSAAPADDVFCGSRRLLVKAIEVEDHTAAFDVPVRRGESVRRDRPEIPDKWPLVHIRPPG